MSADEIRQITDARVLAALTHPVRRRLMDALKVDGPATASTLAERIGQAVGNVSHHLHVLGECGLIEQAPELARDRRERWWRPAARGVRWSTADFSDDPATAAVAGAAESLNLDHQVQRVRAWYAADDAVRESWRDAAFSTDNWLRLTPAELAQFSAEVIALFDRWQQRPVPADGAERRPVFVFAHGVPAQP